MTELPLLKLRKSNFGFIKNPIKIIVNIINKTIRFTKIILYFLYTRIYSLLSIKVLKFNKFNYDMVIHSKTISIT